MHLPHQNKVMEEQLIEAKRQESAEATARDCQLDAFLFALWEIVHATAADKTAWPVYISVGGH